MNRRQAITTAVTAGTAVANPNQTTPSTREETLVSQVLLQLLQGAEFIHTRLLDEVRQKLAAGLPTEEGPLSIDQGKPAVPVTSVVLGEDPDRPLPCKKAVRV